jgi:hypothetical protein
LDFGESGTIAKASFRQYISIGVTKVRMLKYASFTGAGYVLDM